MNIATRSLTLEEFLGLPETKPASEFIQGEVIQKLMPQGEHSRLQAKLCEQINQVAESQRIALALPELRCVFGGQAIVPDIAVFRWDRIPRQESGRIANRFEAQPDWSIEILSPDQSLTKVLGKLLHCSQHGMELGWLLDAEEESILIVLPDQRVQLLSGADQVPVLSGLELGLTVEQIFNWLTL
ncbi:Uma2 family endonuclease [Leptolyngbya sp. AN03gr2]|uniref:Uma2 family endonuclease n=1 Tax=unclassified Leptolyngbya TaxID=2650499 RepID=UPI003D320E0F